MKQKCQHDGHNSSTTRPGPMKHQSGMTVADEAQRMLDRWNPATDAPNQWNQANKSWRTNRQKLFKFIQPPLSRAGGRTFNVRLEECRHDEAPTRMMRNPK